MSKYIAHASIGENGKITGGVTGDQTGKEVCIRTWYNKPWNYVLRITNEKVRKQFANNMIDLAKNNNIGYNQSSRNTLLTQAEKVNFNFANITTKCNCDCSSSITICILGAIYKILDKTSYEKAKSVLIVSGNCATTSTLRSRLSKLTMITVKAYNSKNYVAGISNALFGDIYIKEGSHVVCYIDDGKKVNTDSNVVNVTSSLTYTVQKGDTLSSIATKVGMNWKTIADLNNIKSPYIIAVGQILKLAENTVSNSDKKYLYNGLDYSLVFNPTYYANKYNDLKKTFGTNSTKLFEHFKSYGMKEGRQASENFNVNAYRNRYADLQKAFNSNLPKYYEHYCKYGIKEGRSAI